MEEQLTLTLPRPQMNNLLIFLNRAQLQGMEAHEFLLVQQAVQAILTQPEGVVANSIKEE